MKNLLAIAFLLTVAGCERPTPAETSTRPAGDSTPSCAAQEFESTIPSCCKGDEVFWDGTECRKAYVGKCGCACSGPDCGKSFTSMDDCKSAYAHCIPQ
jgi:hypothetical protein